MKLYHNLVNIISFIELTLFALDINIKSWLNIYHKWKYFNFKFSFIRSEFGR